jgi:hypothetical protein
MADSKRQKIVDAVKTRMAAILTAGGYATNLGQNVEEWSTHLQGEDIPAAGVISVCDMVATAAEQPNRSNPRETVWLMPIQIRIFLPKNRLTMANLRTAMKDVSRAIRQDDRWKVDGVGLVMISRPLREGPIIPEDSFEIAGAIVEFEVQYITQKFNAEE